MRRNFAVLRNGKRFGQEKAAPVSGIADALRNSCPPRQPGGLEGILKQEGQLELLRAKFADQGGRGVNEHRLVTHILVFVKRCDEGAREDRDLRFPEMGADGAERW